MKVEPHNTSGAQEARNSLRPFSYKVAMIGYEPIEGTLLAHDTYAAMSQAVLLFEQSNDILVVDEEMHERICFYCPFVKRAPFNN